MAKSCLGPTSQLGTLLCILIAALLVAPCGWTQTTMGAVSGTVHDPSGGVIPNVSVVLTNTATNVVATTNTNEVGFYIFPAVVPGSYSLTAESPGMQKFEGTFIVRVADRVVIDPALTPGATATAVEVRDITPLVSTDNPTASTTLERERINQLPINGRSLSNFLSDLVGVEGTRFNGIFNDATEWVLDGAVISDRRWNGSPSGQPAVDAIQEFTVVSNAVSAKYSRPAEIVVSMKSGTNGLHGSAFETNRNNAVGLARARTDTFTKAPYLNRNEFGINAGGPLIVPKVYNGKDKTFWWFGYEGRQSISNSTVLFNVPTAAMANGDFSGYKDAQGRLSTIYDPLSTGSAANGYARSPFPGNVIPSQRESPLAKYLFSIVPLPTNTANPVVDVNWYGATRTASPLWYTDGRVDHRFSERDQVHASVQYTMSSTLYPTTAGGVGQPMLNGVAGMEFDSNLMMSLAPTWIDILAHVLQRVHHRRQTQRVVRRRGGRHRLAGQARPAQSAQHHPLAPNRHFEHGQLRLHHERYQEEPRKRLCVGRQHDQDQRQARATVRHPRAPRLSEHPGPAKISGAAAQLRHPGNGPLRFCKLDSVQPRRRAAHRHQCRQYVPRICALLQ